MKARNSNYFFYDEGMECVSYLLEHFNVDGRFDYYYDVNGRGLNNCYNILRHSGTLYAIYQWINENGHKNFPTEKFEPALSFCLQQIHAPHSTAYMAGVMEREEFKLGGSALALLMLTGRCRSAVPKNLQKEMRKLAEFVIWMQEPSGKYLSKYSNCEKRFLPFHSVYYPGEAMLALIRFTELDKDPRWMESVILGADYLLKNPVLNKAGVHAHNHWFAIALTELYQKRPNQAYYEEFWKIAKSTLRSIPFLITSKASSASIATHGETLVSGLLLEIHLKRTDRIIELRAGIEQVLDYCLRLQVKIHQFDDPRMRGGIMAGPDQSKVRIDYVQHTLQVITGYRRSIELIE